MKLSTKFTFVSALVFLHLFSHNLAKGEDDAIKSVNAQPDLSYFSGEWQMRGRFKFNEAGEWLATKSHMNAKLALDGKVITRTIEAPQIGLKAIDIISLDPASGVIQYLYQTNREPNALVFEGACKDDSCQVFEMLRVCGIRNKSGCDSRTTISIESDNRFVARDYQNTASQEYMSREVVYERQ
ncbi:MAG: hypothetical protein AAF385_05170 [Pseudomonadota bacterium]